MNMKKLFSLLPLIFLLLCACYTYEDDKDLIIDWRDYKIDISDIPTETIVITESDYQLKTVNGWDMHTEHRVYYTDNYIFDPEQNDKFVVGTDIFEAKVEGGVANSTVNGMPMCDHSTQNCDFTEYQPNGSWRKAAKRKATGEFELEFITLKATKMIKVQVKNLPGKTSIIDYDSLFSNDKDNRIVIKKNAETDSVLVELLLIPKEILNGKNTPSWGWTAVRFRPEVEGNTLFIKKGDLLKWPISPKDTVFLNVATIKRTVNVIDNIDVGFNYQMNNVVPIKLDRGL